MKGSQAKRRNKQGKDSVSGAKERRLEARRLGHNAPPVAESEFRSVGIRLNFWSRGGSGHGLVFV